MSARRAELAAEWEQLQSAGQDALLGGNLARLRGEMTQTELAQRMRAAGHKWTQPTVVSVEKGERPLRFSEGIDACVILGVDLYDLVRYPPMLDFFAAQVRAEEDLGALIAAAKRYEASVYTVGRAAEDYKAATGDNRLDDEVALMEITTDGPVDALANSITALRRHVEHSRGAADGEH